MYSFLYALDKDLLSNKIVDAASEIPDSDDSRSNLSAGSSSYCSESSSLDPVPISDFDSEPISSFSDRKVTFSHFCIWSC
jgi:hypothetical protein